MTGHIQSPDASGSATHRWERRKGGDWTHPIAQFVREKGEDQTHRDTSEWDIARTVRAFFEATFGERRVITLQIALRVVDHYSNEGGRARVHRLLVEYVRRSASVGLADRLAERGVRSERSATAWPLCRKASVLS
jgi:hypothetical protein